MVEPTRFFYQALSDSKVSAKLEAIQFKELLSADSGAKGFRMTNRAFVFGPSGSGKSFLFFQYAMSYAKQGKLVLWLLPKKNIANLPQVEEDPAMTFVVLKTYSSAAELESYLTQVHQLPFQPDLVLLEDLSSSVVLSDKRNFGADYLKVLTFVSHACDYFDQQKNCVLLVSDLELVDLVHSYLPYVETFLPVVFKIQELAIADPSNRKYALCLWRRALQSSVDSQSDFKLQYSISPKSLKLLNVMIRLQPTQQQNHTLQNQSTFSQDYEIVEMD